MSKERKLLKKALKYVGLSSNDLAEDLYDEIDQLLAQPEQEPVTNEPTTTAMAVMPNGVRVSNVYDAYEEGRKSVMVEQEPSSDDYMYNKLKEDYEYLLNQMEQTCEPLSDDEIYMGFQSSEITDISLRSFVIGVKFAEREHGIGGGE